MFEFKVNLNDDDYIAFNKYVLLNNPASRKNINKTKRSGPIMFYSIGIAVFILSHDFTFFLIEMALITVISIVWVMNSDKIYAKSVENNIKNFMKEGEAPYNDKESVITFNNETFDEISKNIDSKTKYSIVKKVAVTEEAVYIFINATRAYILPTRIFSDNEEKEKFIEFINSKVDCIHSEEPV